MKSKYRSNVEFTRSLNYYRKSLELTIADLCIILEIADRTAHCWIHGRAPHPLTQEGAIARLRGEERRRINLTNEQLVGALKKVLRE